MAEPFAISPYGLDFIRRQEGYRPRAYGDFKQNSIGYGTRAKYPGEVIDKAEAERRLNEETGKVSNWLASNVTRQLSDNQEDALISAGYNLGTGPSGLGRLLGDINAGAFDSVAARLPSFNKAGGEVNPALVRRRAEEVALLTGKDPNAMNPTMYDELTPFLSPFGATTPQVRPAPIGGPSAGPPPAGGPVQLPPMPSGRYSKLADALMASAAGAKPTGWGSALNAFGDAALGYSLGSKADNEQKSYQSALSQALSGADPAQMTETLIASGDPDLQKFGIQQKMAAAQAKAKASAPLRGRERYIVTPNGVMDLESEKIVPGTAKLGTAGNAEYGTSPQFWKDKDGKLHVRQLSKAGGDGIDVNLPEGAEWAPGLDQKNTGTDYTGFNRKTGAVETKTPIDVAGKGAAAERGKLGAQAQAALPAAKTMVESAFDAVNKLRTHAGLDMGTGFSSVLANKIPGTPAYDFAAMNAQAKAKAFMGARDALKGAGQVTDFEGNKGEQAIANLDAAQSRDQYLAALDTLETMMRRSYEDLQSKAGLGGGAAPSASGTVKWERGPDGLPRKVQ